MIVTNVIVKQVKDSLLRVVLKLAIGENSQMLFQSKAAIGYPASSSEAMRAAFPSLGVASLSLLRDLLRVRIKHMLAFGLRFIFQKPRHGAKVSLELMLVKGEKREAQTKVQDQSQVQQSVN